MAYKCDNCRKGIMIGHAVSHAKNRTRRIFRPNLQRLRVWKKGFLIKVRFCARCIKRIKKYGRIGSFFAYQPKVSFQKEAVEDVKKSAVKEEIVEKKEKKQVKTTKKPKKEKKEKKTLEIEDIVGKKSQ